MYWLILAPLLFVLFFVFLVLIVVAVFRDDVEVYWMDLRNFQFGFTLWAAQDLPLFHFVFVNIDLGRTLRTADHRSILRKMNARLASKSRAPPSASYYIPRLMMSTPCKRLTRIG